VVEDRPDHQDVAAVPPVLGEPHRMAASFGQEAPADRDLRRLATMRRPFY
jgi:hypothetical protein